MNGTISLLFASARRIPLRREFRIAFITASTACSLAFIESCLHFFGADIGELPSAAYGWAWNMDIMQINTMRVFLYFLMGILAAMVASGIVSDDVRSGYASCMVARSSLSTYLSVHGMLAFAGGFALVLAMLTLLQLLAFVAFPVEGGFFGYLDMPAYLGIDPGNGFLLDMEREHPYLFNAVYIGWSSAWAGSLALISYGLSLFPRMHRMIALLSPTLVLLACFNVLPHALPVVYQHLPMFYAYPNCSAGSPAIEWFIVLPLLSSAVGVVLSVIAVRCRGDVML